MTSDSNTSEALDLAQQILVAQTREAEIDAQQKRLNEERAELAARQKDLREKFSRLIVNGTAKAAPAPASNEDDEDDGENDEDDEANGEENESQRAQVLAFYAGLPGKKIPLTVAIQGLSEIPEKAVRTYSSKFAGPDGPLKRVKRGVYKYVGKTEE